LTLREEKRLEILENRVLRRFSVSKRDDMIGDWRKLHNKDHLVKKDEMSKTCSTHGREDECI
jgi:hypothetical protein